MQAINRSNNPPVSNLAERATLPKHQTANQPRSSSQFEEVMATAAFQGMSITRLQRQLQLEQQHQTQQQHQLEEQR